MFPDRHRIAAATRQVRHNGVTGRRSFDEEVKPTHSISTIYHAKNQKRTPLKTIGDKK